MKNSSAQIQVVATSVRGVWHENQNLPCQDYFCHQARGQKLVAVVADGAGSAKYGKIGAKIVCETLCDVLISGSMKQIKKQIMAALETTREKLILHRLNKQKSEEGLIDFAATVVGAVCHKQSGIFFHIGDGAAMAFLQKPAGGAVISRPENGHFSCETYFYTMDDWKDSLRFTPFEKAQSLMLMTDGVTGFAFKNGFAYLEKKFVEPIDAYLSAEKSHQRARRALNNTLSTQTARRLNPDDKTLLWARLKK